MKQIKQISTKVDNKTENVENGSKLRPERPGTPFKRRAMENYVGLYRIYAFTSAVARFFVLKNTGKFAEFVNKLETY